MEIDDNQAGSFTLDATFSDPEFSYDRQADDSMGFSSNVNYPLTAIEDSVGLYCAKVCIPPFTEGRKQLTRHEVDWSREISHVRVHVEHVIGQLKQKYTALQSVIPITLL